LSDAKRIVPCIGFMSALLYQPQNVYRIDATG
jgi:hypothetical protein